MAQIQLVSCVFMTLFALGSMNPYGRHYLITQSTNPCITNPTEPQIAVPQVSMLQHYLNSVLNNNNCQAGDINALLINRLCSNSVWGPIVDPEFAANAVEMVKNPTLDLYRSGVGLNAVPGNALPNVVNNYIIVTPELLKNASKNVRENLPGKTNFRKYCNEIMNGRRNSEGDGRTTNKILKNMALKSQTSDEIDEIIDKLNAEDRKLMTAFMEKFPEVPEHVVIALLPSLKKHPKRNSSRQEPKYAVPYNNFGDWMSYWSHNFPMWQNYQQYFDNLYKQYQVGNCDRSLKQNEVHRDNSDETYHKPGTKIHVKPMTDIYYENIPPVREAFTYKTHVPDKEEIVEKILDSRNYKIYVPRDEIKARHPKNEITENILVSKLYSEPKASYLKGYGQNNFPYMLTYSTPQYKKGIMESPSGQSELGHEYEILNLHDNRTLDKENYFDIQRDTNPCEGNGATQPYNQIKGSSSITNYIDRNPNTCRNSDDKLFVLPPKSYIVSEDIADRSFARFGKEKNNIDESKKSDIVISKKSKNLEPETIINNLLKYDDAQSVDSSKSKHYNHKYDDCKTIGKSAKIQSVTAVEEDTEKTYMPLHLEEVDFETKPVKGQKNEANLQKSEDKTISSMKSMDRMTRESITKPTLVETVEAQSKVVRYPSYREAENTETVSSTEEIVINSKGEKPQEEKKYVVVAETISSDLEEFWKRRGRSHRIR